MTAFHPHTVSRMQHGNLLHIGSCFRFLSNSSATVVVRDSAVVVVPRGREADSTQVVSTHARLYSYVLLPVDFFGCSVV